MNPFNFPKVNASGYWDNGKLHWKIEDMDVSDEDLRRWCYKNLDYPFCYIEGDVIRAYHTNAWYANNRETA